MGIEHMTLAIRRLFPGVSALVDLQRFRSPLTRVPRNQAAPLLKHHCKVTVTR
jgi:hypothetical protein